MVVWLLAACTSARADEVGMVMWSIGEATVEVDTSPRAAAPELPLDRDDVLKTGEDGAIIVLLHNDHLVRVDADLELAVSDLVMLGAPKAAQSVKVQFDRLLYEDEHSAVATTDWDRAERIAGWHARRTAATSVTGAEEERASDEPEKKAEKTALERDGASSGGGGMARPDAPPAPPRTRGLDAPPAPPPPPAESAKDMESEAEKTSDSTRSRRKDARSPSGVDALREAVDTQAVRKCLVAWRTELGLSFDSVTIVLHVRDGVVRRASGEGGLHLPDCVRSLVLEQAVEGKSRKVRIEVDLE